MGQIYITRGNTPTPYQLLTQQNIRVTIPLHGQICHFTSQVFKTLDLMAAMQRVWAAKGTLNGNLVNVSKTRGKCYGRVETLKWGSGNFAATLPGREAPHASGSSQLPVRSSWFGGSSTSATRSPVTPPPRQLGHELPAIGCLSPQVSSLWRHAAPACYCPPASGLALSSRIHLAGPVE